MNKIMYVVLAVVVILALLSGITKLMLMPQDVAFFGKYGFSNPLLMAFGALQVLGGVLLVLPKTRLVGAMFVAITFLISAAILLAEKNYAVAGITVLVVVLLAIVVKQSKVGANQA